MSIAGAETSLPMADARVAGEIRAELARRNMGQKDLARLCFVSQPWVSRRLSGVVGITLNDADVMATALGLTLADLVFRAFSPPRSGPGGGPTVTKVAGGSPPVRHLTAVVPARRVTSSPPTRPLLQLISRTGESNSVTSSIA